MRPTFRNSAVKPAALKDFTLGFDSDEIVAMNFIFLYSIYCC